MTTQREDYLVDGVSVRSLPKVSLHDHLDGGLRAQTVLELADDADVEAPADTERDLGEWVADRANSGSLVDYLTVFGLTTAVMQTEEALARVAREAVEDLAADGVIYAELRWAPEQHQRGGLSLDEAVEAVQEGIDAGIARAARAGRDIRVGQLVSAMRHEDRGLEIAKLATRHQGSGVVGFDIAGPEDGFAPSRLRPAFDHLAAHLVPVTVHAGEAAGLESVRSALFDGRALRLGHGVRLADDLTLDDRDPEDLYVSLGETAQWVKDRQIALELSPTSNLQTGAIEAWGETIDDHPFDLFYQLGFLVTVNTDNRLVSGTSLSRELWLLADAFGYDLDDLEQFQLNAASSAFLTLDDREDVADMIVDGFDDA